MKGGTFIFRVSDDHEGGLVIEIEYREEENVLRDPYRLFRTRVTFEKEEAGRLIRWIREALRSAKRRERLDKDRVLMHAAWGQIPQAASILWVSLNDYMELVEYCEGDHEAKCFGALPEILGILEGREGVRG